MRVLYVSATAGVHDRRWLQMMTLTHEVQFVTLLGDGTRVRRHASPDDVVGDPIGDGRVADLRAWAAEWSPDLVHCGPISTVGCEMARLDVAPVVQMSWGFDILVDARVSAGARDRVRRALSAADGLVVDCQTVLDEAGTLGYRGEPSAIIPWGVDLQRFTAEGAGAVRADLGIPAGAFVCFTNRAWEPQYRVPDVLAAFALAATRHADLHLVVGGGGSLEPSIRAQVASSAASDRIHVVGHMRNEALPAYYRAADLYLAGSPSDGSSVSMLESMASGTAVLVPDISSNREWVRHGESGYLAPVADVAAFAEVISQARARPEDVERVGVRARQVVRQRADWAQAPAKLEDLYRRVLSSGVMAS